MEQYEYLGTVGEGAYGCVWKCRERATGRIVAVKGFKQAHEDPEIMRLALREVRVLKSVRHANVVQLLEAFKSRSGRVYLVFEYVERSVFGELELCAGGGGGGGGGGGLPPQLLKVVLWQMLQAVAYLHANKVVHRDIKPANVLLTADNAVKLCDFGFARFVSSAGARDVQRLSSYVVTRWYRAPEVLVSDDYGPPADVWALGCTFAELATGRTLFPGRSTADQLWLIMRCLGQLGPRQAARLARDTRLAAVASAPPLHKTLRQRLPEADTTTYHLIQACLNIDPGKRPTAAELLQQPCFWDLPKLVAGTALEHIVAGSASTAAATHRSASSSPSSSCAAGATPAAAAEAPLPPSPLAGSASRQLGGISDAGNSTRAERLAAERPPGAARGGPGPAAPAVGERTTTPEPGDNNCGLREAPAPAAQLYGRRNNFGTPGGSATSLPELQSHPFAPAAAGRASSPRAPHSAALDGQPSWAPQEEEQQQQAFPSWHSASAKSVPAEQQARLLGSLFASASPLAAGPSFHNMFSCISDTPGTVRSSASASAVCSRPGGGDAGAGGRGMLLLSSQDVHAGAALPEASTPTGTPDVMRAWTTAINAGRLPHHRALPSNGMYPSPRVSDYSAAATTPARHALLLSTDGSFSQCLTPVSGGNMPMRGRGPGSGQLGTLISNGSSTSIMDTCPASFAAYSHAPATPCGGPSFRFASGNDRPAVLPRAASAHGYVPAPELAPGPGPPGQGTSYSGDALPSGAGARPAATDLQGEGGALQLAPMSRGSVQRLAAGPSRLRGMTADDASASGAADAATGRGSCTELGGVPRVASAWVRQRRSMEMLATARAQQRSNGGSSGSLLAGAAGADAEGRPQRWGARGPPTAAWLAASSSMRVLPASRTEGMGPGAGPGEAVLRTRSGPIPLAGGRPRLEDASSAREGGGAGASSGFRQFKKLLRGSLKAIKKVFAPARLDTTTA